MRCYFRVSIAGSAPKTILFELHDDMCPITCKNFLDICKSKHTASRPSNSKATSETTIEPTYRGTEFHRIVPNFMIQGGDFTLFDGKGGYAHPSTNSGSQTFPDENFSISHSTEGILSMANRGKNTNGSQYFITLNKCLHLDGKHVAFGRVVKGIDVVREIAGVETEGDRPVSMQRVVIIECGEGWDAGTKSKGDSNSSRSSQSSYSRYEKKKDRKHRKEKKQRRHNHKREHKHSKRRRDKIHEESSGDESKRHAKKKKARSRSKHRRRDDDDSDLSSSDSGRRRRSSSSRKRRKDKH